MDVKANNVYDYFLAQLGQRADDTTLRELEVDSPCGEDCKRAIDSAVTLIKIVTGTIGYCPNKLHIIDAVNVTVSVMWRG